ncbi:MAG TPA: protein kinase [Acidobacteriota bacterium]|nr:protein kinase [Acidobacteriota bacterium]
MKSKTVHQYQILRRLGAGGAGVVYSAFDMKLMRPVVLKKLHRGAASDQKRRARILREARMASAIEHPNVCPVYEVGEDQGNDFIVMQFVEGRTLEELIEEGPLNLYLALSLAIQTADGLAAAHRLGILHRDLKPANLMISDNGMVKILDFGLAVRTAAPEVPPEAKSEREELTSGSGSGHARKGGPPADGESRHAASAVDRIHESGGFSSSGRMGTFYYMAPEQFVTLKASEQTDIFALGLILYQTVTGRHPFWYRNADQNQVARAIQYNEAPALGDFRPDVPWEFQQVVSKALEKQPSKRYKTAADLRDALKTVMKSLHYEVGVVPGEASAVLPAPEAKRDKRSGIFSLLAERFLGAGAPRVPANTLAVLPFRPLGESPEDRFLGFALADAVSTRLSRISGLKVRPSSTVISLPHLPANPAQAGKQLRAAAVLQGKYSLGQDGFTLNWQLLDSLSETVLSGGTVSLAGREAAAIQSQVSEEIHAALSSMSELRPASSEGDASNGRDARRKRDRELPAEYLEARAVLTSYALRGGHGQELEQARGMLEGVLQESPQSAPVHSALGISHLLAVRNGAIHGEHLKKAQDHLAQALKLDPQLVEANLFRLYTFLWRGEKSAARRGVQNLLEKAPDDPEVHTVAGVIQRLDGLYPQALESFSEALRLNPAVATTVYYQRGRTHVYRGDPEAAFHEVNKGLALEPRHTLLRSSLGYLLVRFEEYTQAVETLQEIVDEDPHLRLAYPTLAIAYLSAGNPDQAHGLISEEILSSGRQDGDMAYRLATFFAVAAQPSEALDWLRKAIYLGNESYPWLSTNPLWTPLHNHPDLKKTLQTLRKTHTENQRLWPNC